jgi:GalNAc-alpha-(1->4)-GalNAc-alpha-(1->3)-diNAcBac-PP-undecaprenol alpha-1,4-N-acetyl-D-galactosaminyltransferase
MIRGSKMPSLNGGKKKIAFVIPSLQAGGMERVMSELINQFIKKEAIEIHLILYGIHRDIFYAIPDDVFIHRPTFRFNNKFRLFYTIKTLWFLRKKINFIRPDTILSFGESWNNFVLLALYRTSFPVYVSDRCQPDKKLNNVHEKLRKWLYQRANGIIIQTEQAKKIYQKKFQLQNLKVIGNPIRFVEVEDVENRDNIVLSVGRLIESKHHDQLIRVFAKLNRPNWKLVIVGGDALKQENMSKLKELIREFGMTDKIELTGSIKNVASYYLKSKVFAFTSSSEGFPNVIGEALASGLPVVTFDCTAGPADMVTDGYNGHLVELFDYSMFSQKLAMLMDDENYRRKLALNTMDSIQKFNSHQIGEIFYHTITERFESSAN